MPKSLRHIFLRLLARHIILGVTTAGVGNVIALVGDGMDLMDLADAADVADIQDLDDTPDFGGTADFDDDAVVDNDEDDGEDDEDSDEDNEDEEEDGDANYTANHNTQHGDNVHFGSGRYDPNNPNDPGSSTYQFVDTTKDKVYERQQDYDLSHTDAAASPSDALAAKQKDISWQQNNSASSGS